ncbi:MAG: DUF5678 domain-containing protein [Candidatus Hodarchaeales archaeon]|jgi:hypothetical protein
MQTNYSKWIEKNYVELQKKYAGKYIAIQGKKVISTGDTVEEAYRKAKQVSEEKFLLGFIIS